MKNGREFYSPEELEAKVRHYQGLPEKHKRYFLATEYFSLGKGSQRYLSRVFNCSRQPIVNAVKELRENNFQPDYARQRKPGGGRKKKNTTIPA
jgi:hypothetical protein